MLVNVRENITEIRKTIPENVKLVLVSKTQPISLIEEAYQEGERIFGENKVQELQEKYEILPKDIEWHFIGHLQTNKVKYIASFIKLIHGVDNLRLLETINKEALKHQRTIDCLLQFHIADEETKFGLNEKEAKELLESENFKSLHNIRIVGVMGMATYTENKDKIREEFRNLYQIFESLKSQYFNDVDYFKELSMGMSGDYPIAIEEGSTMVRIGSSIFGKRNYIN